MTLRTLLRIATTRGAALTASALGAALLPGVLLLGLPIGGETLRVAQAQKKGGNPPPSPVLPNVRYALTWLDGGSGGPAFYPGDINKSGEIAGRAYDPAQFMGPYTAVAYSASTGTLNLNNLGAPWRDLNLNEAAPDVIGWRAKMAYGINDGIIVVDDNGFSSRKISIVGSATHQTSTLPLRAFLLEDAFGPAPRFWLLPTVGAGNQVAQRINNNGEAVGNLQDVGAIRYSRTLASWPWYEAILEIPVPTFVTDINDDGIIISGSYRQFVSGAVPSYSAGYNFNAISNGMNAMIGGSRDKSGKNGLAGGTFQLPAEAAANAATVISPGTSGNYVYAINDHGDLCFVGSDSFLLYYDPDSNRSTPNPYGVAGNGILPVIDMVLPPTTFFPANTYNEIRLTGMNNRDDETGLGQICGFAFGSDRGFLLTPYVLPAP